MRDQRLRASKLSREGGGRGGGVASYPTPPKDIGAGAFQVSVCQCLSSHSSVVLPPPPNVIYAISS